MMGMLSSGLKLDPTNFAKMLHISGLLKELSSMEKIDAAKDVLSPFIQMEDDALVCRFSTDSEVELTGHVNEVGRHKVKDRLELDLAILAAQIRQIPSIEIKGLYKDGSKWSKVVEVTKNSIHLQPAFSLPPTE
jgi:hypothetical protein